MKIIKRHHATLIELIIALSLTMIILTTLSYFYRQMDHINTLADKDQQEAFGKLALQTRLSDILPKALGTKDGDFFFLSGEYVEGLALSGTRNLLFLFDNKMRLSTDFSNAALARLYVDNKNRLCLAVWPAPVRWEPDRVPPVKIEVLSENVVGLDFAFYVPPVKDRKRAWERSGIAPDVTDKLSANIAGEWRKEWTEELDFLPAMIKVTVTQKTTEGNQTLIFTYPLVRSPFFVFYDR